MLFQGEKIGPGKDGTRRIRVKAVSFCHCCFHLLFWAAQLLLFSGDMDIRIIEPNVKEKKRKEKAVPFSRTQGCPANAEVTLLCVKEQRGRGRNAGLSMPAQWERKLLQQFLYSMYRARCKPAPQIQNTQRSNLKTNKNKWALS